jgi:hypothetical protein
MFNVESKLAFRLPPKKRYNACQVSDDGKLMTEKPVRETMKVVPMFNGEKGVAANE